MDIAGRIERRLKALSLSPEAASKKAGLARGAVGDILSGKSKSPRAETLMKLSAALEIDLGVLLAAEPQDWPLAPDFVEGAELPIRYEVAAGSWLAQDELREEPFGHRKVPIIEQFARWPQWLERIVGDSINRLIPDGALIHVIDAIAMGYAPRHDDLVVVVRTRAQGAFLERSVKQVELTPQGPVLWPRSHNERWSEPLRLGDGVEAEDGVTVEIAGYVARAYILL